MAEKISDEDFINLILKKLYELYRQRLQNEKIAREVLIFEELLKPQIRHIIESEKKELDVVVSRSDIIKEFHDYDIRKCMDNDFIWEIAKKGYQYCPEISTPSTLVFRKKCKSNF